MAFWLHTASALSALALGALILRSTKGSCRHRALGRLWVTLMLTSAVSSFWLGGGVFPVLGHFGPIHLLSVWVLVSLAAAVTAARQGRVQAHRRWTLGAYLGLVGAFIWAMAPGRWMASVLGLWG